jgi:hypothetical protein
LSVLATSLPPAPNGFSYRTPAAASSDGLRERLSDVCIELAILGHQIQDALDCPVTSWRTLEAIVQTVERCRSTYSQGVGSQHAGLRRTIAKMYSREDVQSISWRSAGDELLAALAVFSAQLDRQLEQPGPLAATSFEPGATDPFFDMFFDRLRDVGVGITASDFVP